MPNLVLSGREKKEVIKGIFEEEKERQHRIQALKLELFEQEQLGVYCNADRIKAIIDELEIIDPCPEEYEVPVSEVQTQKEKAKIAMRDALKKREAKMRKTQLGKYGRRFAAMVAVMFVVLTVSVSAAGFNIFTLIANWTKELFSFGNTHETECFVHDLTEPIHEEYDNLSDAYRAFRIPLSIPAWTPKGYELQKVRIVHQIIDEHTLTITYINAEGERLVFAATVYHHDMESTNALFEKTDDPLTYTYNDTVHYIMINNSGEVKATWSKEDIIYIFYGNITVEEAQNIIKSYY